MSACASCMQLCIGAMYNFRGCKQLDKYIFFIINPRIGHQPSFVTSLAMRLGSLCVAVSIDPPMYFMGGIICVLQCVAVICHMQAVKRPVEGVNLHAKIAAVVASAQANTDPRPEQLAEVAQVMLN